MKSALYLYLVLWFIGAVVSFIIQLFFPMQFGELTSWGFSGGWQREIAIWNLGVIVLIFLTCFNKSFTSAYTVVLTLIILSIFLGINHVFAFIQHTNKLGNLVGFAANFMGVIIGIFCIYIAKAQKGETHT